MNNHGNVNFFDRSLPKFGSLFFRIVRSKNQEQHSYSFPVFGGKTKYCTLISQLPHPQPFFPPTFTPLAGSCACSEEVCRSAWN